VTVAYLLSDVDVNMLPERVYALWKLMTYEKKRSMYERSIW